MKKLLLIVFTLACFIVSKANPIAAPMVTLSELKFESNGDWVIELQYYYMDNRITIDSIWIKSTSGISRLKQFDIRGNICVLLVRNDSLMSNLNINPVSDSIQIIFSSYGYSHMSEPVTYGYTNGMLKSPRAGQSIAATSNSYNNTYSLDNSPTIGGFNDSTGMCGSIKGHIYDKNNQLLTRTNLGFSGLAQDFSPNPDGTYSARIYSCNNHITSFDDYILPYSGRKNGVYISPIYVSIEPDTIVTVDIHLLGSVVDGIDKVQMNEESLFRISPNPIKDLSFKYEISIPVKSSTSYIELISLSGQKIGQFPVTENTGKINLPANTINGMYTLRLFVNNKNYANSKIIIANE